MPELSNREKDAAQCGPGTTASDYQELSYEDVVSTARAQYAEHSNDDIEVDDDPPTSRGDTGCWVQAWVWVRYPEKEE